MQATSIGLAICYERASIVAASVKNGMDNMEFLEHINSSVNITVQKKSNPALKRQHDDTAAYCVVAITPPALLDCCLLLLSWAKRLGQKVVGFP
jgi:hypothetical protein